jgi:hypothetical protein
MIAYARGFKYDDPWQIKVKRWNARSLILWVLNILCEAYRCRKNVWKNSDRNQWARKNIRMITGKYIKWQNYLNLPKDTINPPKGICKKKFELSAIDLRLKN